MGATLLVRGIGAIVRAIVMCIVVAFPSLALSKASVFGLDLFLVISVISGLIILIEYLARTPSLIEFRLAPPYNRYRMCCLVLVSTFIVVIMNPNQAAGPVFDLTNSVANAALYLCNTAYVPVQMFTNAFGPIPEAMQMNILLWASGAFLVAFASALSMAVILWLQAWPLTQDGFNLWPNMPSFHTRAGRKTESRMVRMALISLLMAFLFPILIAALLSAVRRWLLIDYTQNMVLLFWLIAIWALVPAMAFLRGLALLKVAYMIDHLRKL